MTLSAPVPLAPSHQLDTFSSGVSSLDWLTRRAKSNQASDATRTYVLCDDNRVVGYYALAAAGIGLERAVGRFRRNMPDPIPVALISRLAIDKSCHGKGLGRALFQDAARRVVQASEVIGVRGIIVHAISEEARKFYIKLGLSPSPVEPMTLMVTLAELRASL